MTIRVDTEPIAVWDANLAGSLWFRLWPETARWSQAHISDTRNRCFRAEFHLIDVPFAVLHCYAKDENGHSFNGPDGEPALADPVVEMLDELPPPHLLGKG